MVKVIAGLFGALLLGACEGEKPPATETRQVADAPQPDRSRDDVDGGSADDGATTTMQPRPADPTEPEDEPVAPTPIAPEPVSSSDAPRSPEVAEPVDSGGPGTPSMPPRPSDDAGADAGTAPADLTPPSDTCPREPLSALSASAVNNYRFSRTLSFPVVTVAPDSDLTFEWNALEHDIRGRELDPEGDVDTLMLTQWRLTPEDFTAKANADLLVQNDLVAVVVIYTEQARTRANLLEMTSFGMPLEPEILLGYFAAEDFPPNQYTYTAAAVTGTNLGTGIRMIQAFQLDPDSSNTFVELTDDSTGFEYTVDIQGACPIVVPTGATDLDLDWSTIETTASGIEFVPSSVTEVIVARYAMSVAELETNFLVLDTVADRTYRNTAPVGNRVEFESLVGDDGSSFPGVDSDATWVIALVCGRCSSPAPWYLSVLETP